MGAMFPALRRDPRPVESEDRPRPFLKRVDLAMREAAAHDLFILGFLVFLVAAAYQGEGPHRARCLWLTGALVAIFAALLVAVRGGLLRHRVATPLVYRVVLFGCVQAPYFLLRRLLPTASPGSLDEALYRLDLRLFGVEPALWLDRFVTPATTEWFAFFYFSYFTILAVHVLPILFLARNPRLLSEFGVAMFVIVCGGQMVYFLVPGYGPYAALAPLFSRPLPHGTFQDLVTSAVASSGALKDIFPSLHTAMPTTMALFSLRWRRVVPLRYTGPIVGFFALNIIGATLFLRWHYLIDVVAGLALAAAAITAGALVTRWETERRARLGLSPAWPPLFR